MKRLPFRQAKTKIGSVGPLLTLLVCLLAVFSDAQVLARPGWAGSGVAPEAWWPRAVFYRVDPARFQDSDADGTGDLQGISARLDYLQSLGVDAILLDSGDGPSVGGEDSGTLDELIREASRHQLRVVITVTPAMQAGDRSGLMVKAREWLSAGAAGVWVPKPQAGGADVDASYARLLTALRSVLRGMPGQRVLLTDPAPQILSVTSPVPRAGSRIRSLQNNGGSVGELTTAAVFPVQVAQAGALHQALLSVANSSSAAKYPLLRFAGDPPTGSADAVMAATLLFASRGASMFDFGDEIGLDAYPSSAVSTGASRVLSGPVMQWTPVNVQQSPIERPDHHVPVTLPGGITPFGSYRPYVRSPRALSGPVSDGSRPGSEASAPEPLPDPNTLPGFTKGALLVEPIDGARINVATEERDPNSLLKAYRELIALHHDNAALRNGSQAVLDRDAQDTLLWVRRAPAGSQTSRDVIVAANLGDGPVTLQLDEDLKRLGMRSGALRALFTWSPQLLTGETTGALMLPPHSVYIGEVRSGTGMAMGSRHRSQR